MKDLLRCPAVLRASARDADQLHECHNGQDGVRYRQTVERAILPALIFANVVPPAVNY